MHSALQCTVRSVQCTVHSPMQRAPLRMQKHVDEKPSVQICSVKNNCYVCPC